MSNECRNLAEEIAAGRLGKDELNALMDRLERVKKASAGLDMIEGRILKHGQAIADEVTAAALIEKRNALKNVVVENRLMDLIDAADQMTGNPRLGLEAAMVGVNAPFTGAQRSVDKVAAGIMNRWGGGLLNDLKEGGLLAKFNSMKGDLERQVARALHDMNSPEPRGVEVSKDAMAIARIMKKYQDAAKARQNTAGAYIRDRAGYVVRQTHDNAKMARDRDAWKNTIRDKLNFERMEVSPERIEDFLDSAYDAMVTGVRLVDEVSPVEKAFKGPGNLGKKISASRTLDFKDADAWLDYNEQYGTGDLRETFMSGLSSAARATALMDQFGTNPRAMLDRVRQKAKRNYRSDNAKVQGFDGGVINLDHAMDEITGDVNIGATTRVARVFSAYRAIQTMAKLGGAWISALSDLSFMASARNYQGRSMLDAWGDAFRAPMEGMSGGDKRKFADIMGAGLEGQLGDFMSRFNAQDDIAGRTSKLMQLFFKLNLLGPWTDANKRGITFAIARDMAMEAVNDFDALPDDMRRLLGLYDIGAREWSVLRQAVREGPDGRTYLMPGDVQEVRGAAFTGMTQAQQDRFRSKVMESYFSLLASEADFAVPTPGARERAILRRGYRPNTSAGEAIRFITQFKSFGVVALTKVMGRQVYGQGANTLREQLARGAGANMGLINTVVMATAMGYMVMQAKEVLKGREPRPADPKTFVAAAMQGGGLGIYGDFLFGEANRFGGGTLQTAVGPGIGTMAEAVDLFQRTRGIVTGGEEDLRGDYLRFTKSNLPFGNLFYVKPALDYMLWYHMQETINPGYLRRMERRIERENNQQFWLPPSSVVATGGGFR